MWRTAAWLGALVACGDGATGPVVRFTLPSDGVPAPLTVPWPSDVYRSDPDGTVIDGLTDWTLARIEGSEPAALLEQIGALDGFGRQSGVLFSLDGLAADDEIDPESLPATPGACTDPTSSIAWIDVESGVRVPCTAGWDGYARVITVVPETVLEPGRAYVVVVTSDVKLRSGTAIGASAGFADIRDGTLRGSFAPMYADAIETAVQQLEMARSRIVGITVFTTQTTHRGLKRMRDHLDSGGYGGPPTLLTAGVAAPYSVTRFGRTAHPGWTATLDDWLGAARRDTDGNDLPGFTAVPEPTTTGIGHDAIATVLHATYVSPQFTRPFSKTAGRDDGTMELDGSGLAIATDPIAQIPVTIVLPGGPVPVTGFPVVIFQHGATASRFDCLAIANELAREGIATVAIDAPFHGMRATDAADMASNGEGVYQGPDSLKDDDTPSANIDLLGNGRSFLRARAIYWQAVLDLVQVRRLIGNADLSPVADEFGGTAPTLDATKVGVVGMSVGAGLATMLAAVEPRQALDPFVVDVFGARSLSIFTESPVANQQITLLAALLNVRPQSFDANRYSALVALGQALGDGIDPGVYAPDAASEHNIWMVGAAHDEQTPRSSSDALVRALSATQITPTGRTIDGVPQVASPLGPAATGRVVGYFEVAPSNHHHLLRRFAKMTWEAPYPRNEELRFPMHASAFYIRQPVVGGQRAIAAFQRVLKAANRSLYSGPCSGSISIRRDPKACATRAMLRGSVWICGLPPG